MSVPMVEWVRESRLVLVLLLMCSLVCGGRMGQHTAFPGSRNGGLRLDFKWHHLRIRLDRTEALEPGVPLRRAI